MNANDDAADRRISAFYGFKGGSGRSFTLANVAYALARGLKKRVLAIDFDLEAPGLGDFFASSISRMEQTWRAAPGILDLIGEVGDAEEREQLEVRLGELTPSFWTPEPIGTNGAETKARYLFRLWPHDKGPEYHGPALDFMGPGRFGLGSTYANDIMGVDWRNYFAFGGLKFFRAFSGLLRENYDHVLIDLRTGFSASSARAAAAMAVDDVVIFATPSYQSIMGASTMQRWFEQASKEEQRKKRAKEEDQASKDRSAARKLRTIPILSRRESTEIATPAEELLKRRCGREVLTMPHVPDLQHEQILWVRLRADKDWWSRIVAAVPTQGGREQSMSDLRAGLAANLWHLVNDIAHPPTPGTPDARVQIDCWQDLLRNGWWQALESTSRAGFVASSRPGGWEALLKEIELAIFPSEGAPASDKTNQAADSSSAIINRETTGFRDDSFTDSLDNLSPIESTLVLESLGSKIKTERDLRSQTLSRRETQFPNLFARVRSVMGPDRDQDDSGSAELGGGDQAARTADQDTPARSPQERTAEAIRKREWKQALEHAATISPNDTAATADNLAYVISAVHFGDDKPDAVEFTLRLGSHEETCTGVPAAAEWLTRQISDLEHDSKLTAGKKLTAGERIDLIDARVRIANLGGSNVDLWRTIDQASLSEFVRQEITSSKKALRPGDGRDAPDLASAAFHAERALARAAFMQDEAGLDEAQGLLNEICNELCEPEIELGDRFRAGYPLVSAADTLRNIGPGCFDQAQRFGLQAWQAGALSLSAQPSEQGVFDISRYAFILSARGKLPVALGTIEALQKEVAKGDRPEVRTSRDIMAWWTAALRIQTDRTAEGANELLAIALDGPEIKATRPGILGWRGLARRWRGEIGPALEDVAGALAGFRIELALGAPPCAGQATLHLLRAELLMLKEGRGSAAAAQAVREAWAWAKEAPGVFDVPLRAYRAHCRLLEGSASLDRGENAAGELDEALELLDGVERLGDRPTFPDIRYQYPLLARAALLAAACGQRDRAQTLAHDLEKSLNQSCWQENFWARETRFFAARVLQRPDKCVEKSLEVAASQVAGKNTIVHASAREALLGTAALFAAPRTGPN